jgi:L-glyceraldehyde 3-phosphate reductase
LAQLALAWALRIGGADALIVGARSATQLTDSLGTLGHVRMTAEEYAAIEDVLKA